MLMRIRIAAWMYLPHGLRETFCHWVKKHWEVKKTGDGMPWFAVSSSWAKWMGVEPIHYLPNPWGFPLESMPSSILWMVMRYWELSLDRVLIAENCILTKKIASWQRMRVMLASASHYSEVIIQCRFPWLVHYVKCCPFMDYTFYPAWRVLFPSASLKASWPALEDTLRLCSSLWISSSLATGVEATRVSLENFMPVHW